MSIEVMPSTPKDRAYVWHQALGSAFVGDVGQLAYQFDLDALKIREAAKIARSKADQLNHIGLEDAWDACRELSRKRLDDFSQRIEPIYCWDDLILPADVMAQLQEIARQVCLRRQVLIDWGFGKKLAKSSGISALFSGPSGTGKTMAAEVLAGELRLDLYRIDLALIVNKYIGETEKNLKRIFDVAEAGGAILFFDEADALFGKRTEVKDSHDRYANVEVNYLLQRMEDYRGLAILATNRKTDLDRAFLRRLRFQVDFPYPDASGRLRIWQRAFPRRAPLGDIDWDQLTRLDIPGGSIRNIALNAAFLAAHEKSKIEMRHLVHATKREYAKIDKMPAV
jgi:SpoVK/Ycf46/Vps4 family AAA+-type ATPase